MIEHYKNNGHTQCSLLHETWDVLQEIVYILQIPLRTTIALQRHDLTMSDVYGQWTIMQLHLAKCTKQRHYKTSLAKHLLDTTHERKDAIYSNPFMAAALFLDPRFRIKLMDNREKVEEAKKLLCELWRRREYGIERKLASSNDANEIGFQFHGVDELNAYLCGTDTDNMIGQPSEIELILDAFQPERIPPNHSILEFWEANRLVYPELYELAMIVYSVPPAEVTVERDFSHLNHVFNSKRGGLESARLNDIMMLNLNSEVFYTVKSEELRELIAQLNTQASQDQESQE